MNDSVMKLSPEMTIEDAKSSFVEDSPIGSTDLVDDSPIQAPATVDDDDDDDDVGSENPKLPSSLRYNETRAVSLVNGSFGISIQAVSATAEHLEVMEEQCTDPGDLLTSSGPLSSVDGCYVNHGLVTWEKNREKWLHRPTAESPKNNHAKPINVDAIIDAVFSTPQKMRKTGGIGEIFPQSVPLPQMVDILQDLWEAESL